MVNPDGDQSSNLASKYVIFAATFVARTDDEDDTSDVDSNDNSFEQPDDDETLGHDSDDHPMQEYHRESLSFYICELLFVWHHPMQE